LDGKERKLTVYLTTEEEAMATGKHGPGVKKCMEILIKFGEAFGAERLVRVASAHTMPKEPLELLHEMTEGVSRTGAFTTTHPLMSAFSPVNWQAMGIPEAFAARELPLCEERAAVYRKTGIYQTYTCLPMQVGNLPRKGQCLSWIGAGAQLMVNSIVGARTNRDGTLLTMASAITGRAAEWGLLLDENRTAQVAVSIEGLDPRDFTPTDYGALGYYVGAVAQERNIVIDGLPGDMNMEQIKSLMAPLGTSGAVSMCHIVGLTPDAPTLEQALGGKQPSETIRVGKDEINSTKALYGGAEGEPVDMVVFGCPHWSVQEVRDLASLLEGKRLAKGKRLWIGMPHQMFHLAGTMGYTDIIERAGGTFASACMATVPDSPIPDGVKTIATNSFKSAHYISRLQKGRVKLLIGNMDTCVQALLRGEWKGERT
jgi:predicted aconitase